MTVRVLQALTGAQYGGTELSVASLTLGLSTRGIDCAVSVLDGGGPVLQRFVEGGIHVHDLERRHGYAHAARRLARLLRRETFDVIHLYGFRMSLLGRWVARTVRPRPCVVHGIRGLHVTEGMEPHSWRTRAAVAAERMFSGSIDAYIANSDGAVGFLCDRGLPRSRFTVIRNGLDTVRWTREAVDRDRPPLVAAVANFRPVKCLEDLIEALGILQARGRQFGAVLIGDGALRPDLESAVARLALGDRVSLPGQLSPEAIRSCLSRASVFVLPSLWEGMPGSVLEAMALELPVVGTDVPGINEIVQHERTGLLVPRRTPAALADAIDRLLLDDRLRALFGAAARRRVVDTFEVSQMVEQYAWAYRSLAGCRHT